MRMTADITRRLDALEARIAFMETTVLTTLAGILEDNQQTNVTLAGAIQTMRRTNDTLREIAARVAGSREPWQGT